QIEVFDAEGNRVGYTWNYYTATVELTLTNSGSFYILVSDYSGVYGRPYSLFLQRLNVPALTVPIAYGQTTSGVISASAEQDAFSFAGQTGDIVRVVVSEGGDTNFRPQIEVFDAEGNRVGYTRNYYTATVELTLTNTGTFYILVGDLAGVYGRAYNLFVQRLNVLASAVPIVYGQTTSGVINASAEQDAFTFAGQAGDIVRVVVSEGGDTNFRPQIELFDAAGNAIGGTWNYVTATLEVTLVTSDTYYILVSDLVGVYTRAYTLSLTRTNQPSSSGTVPTFDQTP